MTSFARKFLAGELPSTDEWMEHLRAAHRAAPSMSPDAFAAHKTRDGRSSYEILAGALDLPDDGSAVVLDLGCGDGHLTGLLLSKLGPAGRVIGTDMCEEGLAAARRACRDRRAEFSLSNADALPAGGASVDLVLSHMVLMLVLPVEPAIAEIARVLRPGGHLAAVINHPKGGSGFYAELQRLVSEFTVGRFPRSQGLRWGDPRLHTTDGLRGLFHPGTGFDGGVEVEEFELLLDVTTDGPWEFMRNMYFVGMLPAGDRAALKDELTRFAQARAGEDGRVRFAFPMRMLTARRLGG